jgi:UTP---glucose-1-phosphate uridylyltransferase
MLTILAKRLLQKNSIKKKIQLLSNEKKVIDFINKKSDVALYIKKTTLEEHLVIKASIAIGQGEGIFSPFSEEKINQTVKTLLKIEKFYSSIGGIVGYQAHILNLLKEKHSSNENPQAYLLPEPIFITEETPFVCQAILEGLSSMKTLAEIYPLGGAADRLNFCDEKTGTPLPIIRLPFLGTTLLNRLVKDLQSREYLYYKLFKEQLTTPIAIMSSEEKNNHYYIEETCEKGAWFYRPKNSFRLFCQPLVPTVDEKGDWRFQGMGKLILKPGGHGALWKLGCDEGIFDWFLSLNRKKLLIRQANNAVANTDYGMIAFFGIGCSQNKRFGFASCPRQVKATEGINLFIETQLNKKYDYTLTNIEYCNFEKFGVIDEPESTNSPYSKFPSNTNILFADVEEIIQATKKNPIPGILVNQKKLRCVSKKTAACLETTMQNIADYINETLDFPISTEEKKKFKTFITYNHRKKTISTVKQKFIEGGPLLETPEGCFLDILRNNYDLLKNYCNFTLPFMDNSFNDPHHPPFIFLFHPALGPPYSIIAQKIKKGSLSRKSEFQLEIAEVDIENLQIQGSLIVQSTTVMGHLEKELLQYSENTGRVVLRNVIIKNKGIEETTSNIYWKNEITRKESCRIILHGMSEFYAENITIQNDFLVEVPDKHRCCATKKNGKITLNFEKISSPSWHWDYSISNQKIKLAFKDHEIKGESRFPPPPVANELDFYSQLPHISLVQMCCKPVPGS